MSIVAFPAVRRAAGAGQNSFMTFGRLWTGLLCLDRRPRLAGVFFGVVTIKPQIGSIRQRSANPAEYAEPDSPRRHGFAPAPDAWCCACRLRDRRSELSRDDVA
ncbi:DUF2029 domain-containing protein [Paraburkholderia dinghuensis]|uniref:DUF2029 domain-containing protein n=1 Tax=Paraburkholderia dinghuensis TaxID=2305225 RepID=A0A3N6MWJ0_9BURK|nr:DUF2029 domain-containing protein [Paraburkholderia dinghuensis]